MLTRPRALSPQLQKLLSVKHNAKEMILKLKERKRRGRKGGRKTDCGGPSVSLQYKKGTSGI